MARNNGLEEFLVDLNDFKEEVKVHKYKPYEATEFLNRVFRSDEMQIQAFLLQSDQFKESLYRIIRAMETNPDAMVNPQYLKAYADHLQLINELVDKLKGITKERKEAPKAGSFTLNYLTDSASLEKMMVTAGRHDDDDEFGSFEGDEPANDPNDIFTQQPNQSGKSWQHSSNGTHRNDIGQMGSLNLSEIMIPANTSEVMQNLLKSSTPQPEPAKLFTLPDFSKGDPFQKKATRPAQPVKQIQPINQVPFHIREDKLHPIESIFDISVDEGDVVQVSTNHSNSSTVMDLPTLPVLMPILQGSISLQPAAPIQQKKQVNINELISIDIEEFEHQRPAQPILQSIHAAQPVNPKVEEEDDDEFEFADESPTAVETPKPIMETKNSGTATVVQPVQTPKAAGPKLSIFDLDIEPDQLIEEPVKQPQPQKPIEKKESPKPQQPELDLLDMNSQVEDPAPPVLPPAAQPVEAVTEQPIPERALTPVKEEPKVPKIMSIFELDDLDASVNQQFEQLPPLVIPTQITVKKPSVTVPETNIHTLLANSASLYGEKLEFGSPEPVPVQSAKVQFTEQIQPSNEDEDDGFSDFNSANPEPEPTPTLTLQPAFISNAQEFSIFQQYNLSPPIPTPTPPQTIPKKPQAQPKDQDDDFQFVEASNEPPAFIPDTIPEPAQSPPKPVIKLRQRNLPQPFEFPDTSFHKSQQPVVNHNSFTSRNSVLSYIRQGSPNIHATTGQMDVPSPNMFHSQIRLQAKPHVLEGLAVEMKEDWRKIYTLNKYECSQKFYRQLKDELEQLDLVELSNFIKQQLKKVQEITQLSQTYTKVVDEQQEQDVAEVLKSMKSKIAELRRQQTRQIAEMCLSRRGVSLSAQMSNKVVEEMPEYEELYKRIIKSIKNPQKRLESFMQLSLLAIIFRNNHHQKCKTYKASIDKTMKDIEGIKEQLNSLLTQDEATLSQVVSSKDFQAKCVNVERIYLACNRLYEVLKILEGASNLKFRLNKLRTDLNNIYTSINCKQSVQIPLIGESPTPTLLQTYFPIFIQYMQAGAELKPSNIPVCRVCLVADEALRGAEMHEQCRMLTL